MFVLCVFYSKDKRQKPGKLEQRSTDKKTEREQKNPAGGMDDCVVPHKQKSKSQDNQNK
jgi:hypothetical protein